MRQPWCARLQYPGHAPFLRGTVWVEGKGRQEEARTLLEAQWRETSPHPMPPVVEMMPGALVFEGMEE